MPHYMPINLYWIIQNAVQIFHIDRQKQSNLKLAYIVDVVWVLSREAQVNTLLTFWILVCIMLTMCHVLEEFHLQEAFK